MNFFRKFVFTSVILLLFSGCKSQERYIITNKQIGKYSLGDKLKSSFDKNIFFDIIVNKDKNVIESIIVSNNIFKTTSGFSVGSSMSSILRSNPELSISESKIRKGKNRVIGFIGEVIIDDGIAFIDTDVDGFVDLIWIGKNI